MAESFEYELLATIAASEFDGMVAVAIGSAGVGPTGGALNAFFGVDDEAASDVMVAAEGETAIVDRIPS